MKITGIYNFVFDDDFDENGDKKHEYYYLNTKGKKIVCTSVTELLVHHGIAKDYSANPIMASNAQKAAEKGSATHKIVEDYFNNGMNDELLNQNDNFEAIYAVSAIKNLLYGYCVQPEKHRDGEEYLTEHSMCVLYHNETTGKYLPLAGTADFIFQVDEDKAVIVDLKTGDRNPESELWQLSLYSLMARETLGVKIVGAYIVHSQHTKSKTSHKTIEITDNLVDDHCIFNMLDMETRGEKYKEQQIYKEEFDTLLLNRLIAEEKLKEFIEKNKYYELQAEKERLEKAVEKSVEDAEKIMRKNGLIVFEAGGYTYKRSELAKNELDKDSFLNSLTESEQGDFISYLVASFKAFTDKQKAEICEKYPGIYRKYELSQMTNDTVKTKLTVESPLDEILLNKTAGKKTA